MTVKTKKLFFSASERPRTVLNAFLECLYFDKMTVIYAYMDINLSDVCPYKRRPYMDVINF